MSLPPKVQKEVMRYIDSDFIRFLTECVVNLIAGNFKHAQKSDYKRHTKIMSKIAAAKNRRKQRKLLHSQPGLLLLKKLGSLIIKKFSNKRVG